MATLQTPAIVEISGFTLTAKENKEIKFLYTWNEILKEGWLATDSIKKQDILKEYDNRSTQLNDIYSESNLLEFDDYRLFPFEECFLQTD